MRFLCIITAIFASIAALVGLGTMLTSKSAPQEAAGYAMACALAIVPYVFTRALQAYGAAEERERDLKRIIAAIERNNPNA